jgi:hypothetical protein
MQQEVFEPGWISSMGVNPKKRHFFTSTDLVLSLLDDNDEANETDSQDF